jgi:hypothetical protein
VVAPDSAPVDVEDRPLLAFVLKRRELVRLEDRHQVVDPGRAVEPEVRHVLAVADRADHGDELARGDVRLRSHGLDALYDGVDVRLRRPLFHHDHHLSLKPLKLGYRYWRFVARRGGGAGRLAKSRVPAREDGQASH